MLMNGMGMKDCPVLSLHIGGPTAWVDSVIIDPTKLKVVGYYVSGPLVTEETGNVVEMSVVRDFSNLGMIIDSIDELTSVSEVKKLEKIVNYGFSIWNLPVVTKGGEKLGKVLSYVFDTTDGNIVQIVVKRAFFKGILDPELVIGRTEVVKVSNKEIIVKDNVEKITEKRARENFVPDFVNPFHNGKYAEGNATNIHEN